MLGRARRVARAVARSGLIGLLLGCCVPAAAGSSSRFELADGSVIVGELVTVDAGGFVVRSPDLGTIRIGPERLRSMTPVDTGGSGVADPALMPRPGGDPVEALGEMQRRLTGDPEIMGMILDLQGDPELQAALADPRMMGLVLSGDIDALRDEPAFHRLLEHPDVRAIIDRAQLR